jgi:predicted small lipoprotein YifL
MRTVIVSMLVLTALAACGADEPTIDPPLEPAAPDGGQQLATTTYRLEPGEEKYICYQFYSPDEAVAITRVDQISAPGVHHMFLFQAFGRNEPDEPHECNTLIRTTWQPIWVANTGEHSLAMPAGTGFVIAPGTQYIVQLHLQNSGDEPIDVRGALNLTYEHDVSSVIPAGMYGLGSFTVDIPANAAHHEVTVSCTPQKDLNVFGVLPHMHKLGTKIVLERTPAGGDASAFYKIDPWLFGDQPLDMLDGKISAGEHLQLTCSYRNPYDHAVKYGESSDEEMCFFLLFYYPAPRIDGCVVGG